MRRCYEALAAAFEPLLPPVPVPLEPLLDPDDDVPLELDESLLELLLLALPLSLDDGDGELVVPLSPLDFDSGLLDEYRSLYQPLPLSWNAVREMSRSSALAPHASHSVLSGSLIRCWYSNSL